MSDRTAEHQPKPSFWLRMRARMVSGRCLGAAIYGALLSYLHD